MKILIIIYKILKRLFGIFICVPLWATSIILAVVLAIPYYVLTGKSIFDRNNSYSQFQNYLLSIFD